MAQTILLVDDEEDILELLRYNLEREGYRVLTARNGAEALPLLNTPPDLCVLDVMMPAMDGWELSRRIRAHAKSSHVPIIFLTARDSEVDEVLGLELGATDYITKPVRVRTFIARVRKALKPAEGVHERTGPLQTGALRIFPDNYSVEIGNRSVPFPRKEFEVLLYLATHPDRVVSRDTLLNEIWGRDVYVVDRTVDVHIRKIREKLEKHARYIETVKGVGYRFSVED